MERAITIHKEAASGRLLVADPFLPDPHFSRAVVFLCEHGDEGSVGFVLNRPTEFTLPQLIPQTPAPKWPVFQGGPVQLDTLHMLHHFEDTLEGKKIINGVYWGGAFDQLETLFDPTLQVEKQMKLFLGYSGWSPGQLEQEIKEGSWLIIEAQPAMVFNTDAHELWRQCVWAMGNDYRYLANAPLNPQLN